MRTIKYILLAIIMVGIVLISLANRDPVTLHLLPEGIAYILPLTVQVPLFIVLIGAVLLGLVIGYIIEYLRETKHRRAARLKAREAGELKNEVAELKKKTMTEEDEVLALLN